MFTAEEVMSIINEYWGNTEITRPERVASIDGCNKILFFLKKIFLNFFKKNKIYKITLQNSKFYLYSGKDKKEAYRKAVIGIGHWLPHHCDLNFLDKNCPNCRKAASDLAFQLSKAKIKCLGLE